MCDRDHRAQFAEEKKQEGERVAKIEAEALATWKAKEATKARKQARLDCENVVRRRVAAVRFPFGRPMGEPSNADQHRVIAEDALHILETATEPGTLVSLPYRWRREDYARIRQERSVSVKV